MQFEVIRKSHKNKVLIGVVIIILIAVVFLVRNSFAKYQTTKSLKIAEGTINYTVPDFKIMGIYYQKEGQTCTEDNCYEEKESMPESGYTINTTKSYCELNGSKDNNAEIYTDENGQHVIAKFTKGDRCYLYFDKSLCNGSACKTILANVTVKNGTPSFNQTATTDEGVYKAKDESGKDSYYFRGAIENNYVRFANKYWRIIRINGDGTIRLIHQGTNATDKGSIGVSKFNQLYNNNMYVGFKYTSGYVHGTETKSTILGVLETWYSNNLNSYTNKIDPNAGFCGDRTASGNETTMDHKGEINTTNAFSTWYGSYIRLITNKEPVLTCSEEDFYTISGSNKGNNSLTYPIGLITADEVAMAGGVYDKSNSYYFLKTADSKYWTMSPSCGGYSGSNYFARVFIVNTYGVISYVMVGSPSATDVRPVINLRSDVKLVGKGTSSNPYVVE